MAQPNRAIRQDELLHVEHVLNALNCGAALIDRAGLIVHANARLCAMMARDVNEVVGQNFRLFYPAVEDRAHIEDVLSHVEQLRDAEFVLPRPDGTRLPVVTSTRPLPPPLDALHVVTILDISAQKSAVVDLRENMQLLSQIGDNALEHALELKGYSEALEQKVRERTEELRAANLDAIYMLAIASEAKDSDTGRHVRRIERFAEALGQKLGMREDDAHSLGYAAIMHDIGKIHIPDGILKKPGPLDEDERFVMR